MRIRSAMLAAAVGAAAAYLFDPISGTARRQRVRSAISGMLRRPSAETSPLPENLAPDPSISPDVIVTRATTPPTTEHRPDRPGADMGVGSRGTTRPGEARNAAVGEDARIAGDVRAKLQRRPDLGAGELVIDVVNGVAYLSGDLHDQNTFGEVVDLTREVPGVRRVQSLLHLPPSETIPGATIRPSDDQNTA